MVEPYEFQVIDANQPVARIFRELQRRIKRLSLRRGEAGAPARKAGN